MTDWIATDKYVPQLLFASALSAYGLYLSGQNITRLQYYEKQSEKAAEWSNTAAHRLHKTRTTQTSGTATLLLSLVSSTTLLFLPTYSTATTLLSVSLANTALLYAARTHMANFWNNATQTRIPFVERFNEAIRGSEQVVWLLGTLGIAWAGAGLMWGAMSMGWIQGATTVWGVAVGLRVWYWVQKVAQ